MSDTAANLPLRKRSSGLGRGLSALLGETSREIATDRETGLDGVLTIAVTRIAPHPDQPRRHFDEAALDELAASIRARGVIQPVIVRRAGDNYQIVAGERRWRAAQRAQLLEIPVVVRDFDDNETLEVALLENIQRQDLNAIEEAQAYWRLMNEYSHTQDALARLVNKSRSHVANLLRLLELPASVQAMVSSGALSMGHARAIASSDEVELLAHRIVERGLSVRDAEALAKRERGEPKVSKPRSAAPQPDSDIVALERQLGDVLGLPVTIAHASGRGTLTISYSSLDQLDLVCQRLSGEAI